MTGTAFDGGVYGVAPGADFPRALVTGLAARYADQPPEALARVTLYVNTQRMARRMTEIFAEGPPRLLPRLRVITDLGKESAGGLPPSVPSLRRRLELRQLVAALIAAEPDLAPEASSFDLAVSLAALMDEMQGEGVPIEAVTGLDTGDVSGHWARSRAFLGLVGQFLNAAPDAPMDPEARQRRVVEEMLEHWAETPPEHPVIVAGSTGSRGTTALFMAAVARLPNGAVILPGLDREMPAEVWRALDAPGPHEDHPQYRHAAFAARMGLDPWTLPDWAAAPPPDPARNRLVSLALRPAPVTDAWLRDGPGLGDLATATAGLTLVEAADPRQEALTIAIRLRAAVEEGQSAALITPDRNLTRRVTAALDRWGITPDDSAGEPLRQSPVGRLVRQTAGLFGRRLTAEALIALLKHPLVHKGAGRNQHMQWSRELERRLRRKAIAFPDARSLNAFAEAEAERRPRGPDPRPWAEWAAHCADGHADVGTEALDALADRLMGTLELLALGSDAAHDALTLWDGNDGREALKALTELGAEAAHGGAFDPAGFSALLDTVLAKEVRDARIADPRVMIWGTLEARVQGVDLAILGGLNDGVWPELPAPDPWLNRRMRKEAGLLLPERRVGLSAHDFQQAIGAPSVMLTRALREGEAPGVPSRWLNRLVNLLDGLPANGGPGALEAMRARGAVWRDHASALDQPECDAPPAPRPSPQPPVAHRPAELSVTRIERLIRDPYEIYASKILRLEPLAALGRSPDARERGTVLHDVMEAFVPSMMAIPEPDRARALIAAAEEVLERKVPWPAARRLWRARLAAVAERFVVEEAARQADAAPIPEERRGTLTLTAPDFVLTAKADRIDSADDGTLRLYDYKSGAVPTEKQQLAFSKQLLLEVLIAETAGFAGVPPGRVSRARYLSLGRDLKASDAPLADCPAARTREELAALIGAYADPARGYTAQTAPESAQFDGDFLHLARTGEWTLSDAPVPERVGW